MRTPLYLSLSLLPCILLGCSGGGQATAALARRDDLTVSLTAANINIGSRIQATGVSLCFTGSEGNSVSNVAWTLWHDKNGDGVRQDSETLDSGRNDGSKPSHCFGMTSINIDAADKGSFYVSYSAQGANGPIDRRTSLGSILP